MSITIGTTIIPIPYPVADNEVFMENFFALFDGVTAGTAAASKVVVADANGAIAGLANRKTVQLVGSTKTLAVSDAGSIWGWDQTAGSVATLPAASGSGAEFTFFVQTLATTNSHIVKCAGSDVMTGLIMGSRIDSGNAVLGFAAQSTSNTITLNRGTHGSVTLGEYVTCRDVAALTWLTAGMLTSTGAAFATPYSHV